MKRYKLMTLAVVMLSAGVAWGQFERRLIAGEEVVKSWVAGEFFFALLVGVALAVAFQLLLTNLCIAAGLSAAHGLTDEDRLDKRRRQRRNKVGNDDQEGSSAHETVRKFSNIYGIWTMVTATLALFFAAWLAVELVPHFYLIYGVIIGLTIWALFYLTMMVLEVKAVTSLVGGLTSIAGHALKSSGDAIKSIFSKSPESRLATAGRDMAIAVREEILQDHKVQQQLEGYLQRLEPPDMSPEKLRKEITKLLDHVEIEALVKDESWDTERITASLRASGVSAEEAVKAGRSLKLAVGHIRHEMQSGKRPADKVFDATAEVGGVDPQHAEEMRHKVEEYLAGLHDEQLDPEAIKRDIETMFHHPKAGARALEHRLASIDHETLTTILSDKTSLSHDRARKVVDTIMGVRDRLMGKAAGTKAEMTEQARAAQMQAEGKLQHYMNSLHRPELQYAGVKQDVIKLFHDPKAGADALLNRVKRMDRGTLRAVLISLPHMDERRADHVLGEVDKAREEIIRRAERIRDEVEERLDDARHEAMHQADEARRTAANAAWWAFATALVSGGAAALGGIVAFYT